MHRLYRALWLADLAWAGVCVAGFVVALVAGVGVQSLAFLAAAAFWLALAWHFRGRALRAERDPAR